MRPDIFIARHLFALGAAGAIALSTALLAACGGGSSDQGGSASNGAEAPLPADFLGVAVRGHNWDLEREMLVIDREHPETPPRLSVRLTSLENFMLSDDGRFDTSTRTTHVDNPSMAYYVQDHKLFQVSLRKADATVPQQISSLTAVCLITSAGRHTSAGGPTWVEVLDGGPDGDCNSDDDNRSAFVRPGTPATAEATFLPTGVRLTYDTLDRADNALTTLFFLAEDRRGSVPKLVLYHPDLTPAGDVAGGEVSGRFYLLEVSSTNDAGFEAIGTDSLGPRRMSWSTAGASLSSRLYTFQHSRWIGALNMTTDSDYLYLVDGLEIKRRAKQGAGAWETVGSADVALGDEVTLLDATPTRLIVFQSVVGSGQTTLSTIPKSGGAQSPLATTPQGYTAVYTAGEQIIYTERSNDGSAVFSLNRVRSDGAARSTIAHGLIGLPLEVYPRRIRIGNVAPEVLLWCEAARGNPSCNNGNVKSFNLATGITTALGSLALPAPTESWNWVDLDTSGPLFPDSPVVLSATLHTGDLLKEGRPGIM